MEHSFPQCADIKLTAQSMKLVILNPCLKIRLEVYREKLQFDSFN